MDINLEITKGTLVGFIATAGNGKSTRLDPLVALFALGKGSLVINKTAINE